VEHRAEQLAARLGPLGLRVRSLHGLMDLAEREHAASALRAGAVDIVVSSLEAVRDASVLGPHFHRVGAVVLDGVAVDAARSLPPDLEDRPALVVTEANLTQDFGRAYRGAAVTLDYALRPALRIIDRRNTDDPEGVISVGEDVLTDGEKTVVYAVRPEECVRLAAALRERGAGGRSRIAYLHGGLPLRLRDLVTQAFRGGHLDVLVTTGVLDEEALPPDVRHVVIASLLWGRDQFLAVCGGAGSDHRGVGVTLAYGPNDAEIGRRMLDDRAPGRDTLVRLYRALHEWRGEETFLWPDQETWARVRAAVPDAGRNTVGAACAIFEDIGIAARETAPDGRPGWQIRLLPRDDRRDLAGSLRYREGVRTRDAFQAFAGWAGTAPVSEILRAVLS
jgi:single-stranded-DNA-specific exonuclease